MLERIFYPLIPEHRASVRWNFAANVFDGALYAFALSFVSLTTVMPVLVKKMGGSNIAVGLIPVIWTIGLNMPQIFIAGYTERNHDKKGLMLRTGLIQRIAWLTMAVLILALAEVHTSLALTLFFFGLGLAAVGGSLNVPAWFDLVARITPINLRGRLFAVRAILGSIMGVFGGWMVLVILETYSYPQSFALLFFLAFVITMVSFVFLVLLRARQVSVPPAKFDQAGIWRRLPGILKNERNFRNFLIADALLIMALVADAFYAVNAFDRFALTAGYAGRFTIAMTATTVIASIVFGYLADQIGHRLNMMLAAFLLMVTCFVALTAQSVVVYYFVFVGSALVLGLRHISRLPLIAELCSDDDRPTYVALANMLTAPLVVVALLGGWAADQVGYDAIFIVAAMCAVAAGLWMMFRFHEPRTAALSAVRQGPVDSQN